MLVTLGECNCSCHSESLRTKHVKPCCKECPHCHKNIKPAFYESHLLTHKGVAQNTPNDTESE